MRLIVFLFLGFFAFTLRGGELERSYKEAKHKRPFHVIAGIDYIYVINAKKDIGKFRELKKRFSKYDIVPYRFDAVDASNLTYKTLSNVGYRTGKAMEFDATEVTRDGKNTIFRNAMIADPKAVYFHQSMTLGSIARNLDFLSVMYDAYKSKYKVAWIMQDNVQILIDPNVLTGCLVEMEEQDPKWDILYTDLGSRDKHAPSYEDFIQPMRPDVEFEEPGFYASRRTESYMSCYPAMRLGLRTGAESFLVSRAGMRKILSYYHKHRLFIPFEVEIQLIESLNSYELCREVVTD